MLLKVVGVQRMDFRFDDGKEIHGWKLHGIELDKSSDNLIGNTVQTVMIRDDSPIATRHRPHPLAMNISCSLARGVTG